MIHNSSISPEPEVSISHILSPIESHRLTRMISIEINVSESRCNLIDFSLLCLRIQIERVWRVEMRIGDELIHYCVVDQQLTNHEQTFDVGGSNDKRHAKEISSVHQIPWSVGEETTFR